MNDANENTEKKKEQWGVLLWKDDYCYARCSACGKRSRPVLPPNNYLKDVHFHLCFEWDGDDVVMLILCQKHFDKFDMECEDVRTLCGLKNKTEVVEKEQEPEIKELKLGYYRHKKSGEHYQTIHVALNTTNANDGQVMVEYERAVGHEGPLFVREVREFYDKFEFVAEYGKLNVQED